MSKILISLPQGLLAEVDFVAKEEYKNRSELVRDALINRCKDFYQNQNRKKAATTTCAHGAVTTAQGTDEVA